MKQTETKDIWHAFDMPAAISKDGILITVD